MRYATTHRLLFAIALVTIAGLAKEVVAASNVPTYDIVDLGTLSSQFASFSSYISNSGYIAGSTEADAVGWYKGVITKLAEPTAAGQPAALGVNNRGTFVGDFFDFSTFRSVPFVIDETGLHILPALPSSFPAYAEATSINDMSEISGISHVGTNDPFDVMGGQRAVVWIDGQIRDLGTLGGPSAISDQAGLNSRGDVAGASQFDTRVNPLLRGYGYHAALWRGTTQEQISVEDLGALTVQPDISLSLATNVNEADEAVGWSLTDVADTCFGGPQQWGFVWRQNHMDGLPPLSDDCDAEADGINNREQIVGSSIGLSATGRQRFRAVIWIDGQPVDLITLVSDASGWRRLVVASAINDRGEIVGTGVNALGIPRAFLLRPRP